MKKIIFVLIYALYSHYTCISQSLYVDPIDGNDIHIGSLEKPLRSIEKAINTANSWTGIGEIQIVLYPGLYTLTDKVIINPVRVMNDTIRFEMKALFLPDDTDWSPEKMPKIQSISPNNSETQFTHSTGFLIASEHVSIKGIKFLGNPNPAVTYYYPISKENQNLSDLNVSQCMFIGNKEAAPIQGGIWAHGPNNSVSYSIFYECRNAILFFNNVEGFSIKNTIVYGSYESAFWFSRENYSFTFSNNIITNNNAFLVKPKEVKYTSSFEHSIIANNMNYVSQWSREDKKVISIKNPFIIENNIVKNANIELNTNKDLKLPNNHLHLSKSSDGQTLYAGIFKNKK